MTPERHHRIGDLYHRALDLPAERREAFLAEACSDDEALSREVRSLLQAHDQAGDFIDAPALETAATALAATGGAPPFTSMGHYEVRALLGRGGMGEVYRAHDRRLGRDVALKILPDHLALDAQHLARFEREARLLAALNHPNIAALYGLEEAEGRQALVLELVEGLTLADRLARGRLSLSETLAIARQMADALDAAHEQGIVHRDLKPANVALRTDGTVKVLDFGLAKALAPTRGTDESQPNVAETQPHSVIGTAAYMSPEQARGLPVDARTDIWAFGCVLYEMLTARRAFAGDTTSDVIASILERTPDWDALPPETPPLVRRLLRRCLEKEPKRRLRHIGDACLDIHEALAPSRGDMSDPSVPARGTLTHYVILAGVVLGAIAITLFGVLTNRGTSTVVPQPVRFSILPPANGAFLTPLATGSTAPVGGTVSPDGRLLAYTASNASGTILLWVRALDSIDARPLPGTEGAALPFWSPDSKSLGFFGPGKLNRIDIADGAMQVLCDVTRGRGGSWNRDGVIIFAPALTGALSRVAASGGQPQVLTTLGEGQLSHRFPYFLPDGRHFFYYAEDSQTTKSGVFVADVNDGGGQQVLSADSAAVYASTGHVLFVRQGTLFAEGFDLATFDVTGNPVSLAASVPSEGASPAFSVSNTGVLTYRSGPPDRQQFAWFDRTGNVLETVGPPGDYRGVDLSPDGQRVAVHRHEGDGGDIWVFEPRGTTTRVTFDPAHDNSSPIWSPDGTRIAFGAQRDGKWGIYQKPASSTGNHELLVESELPKIPAAWSPDGQSLVYWLFGNSRQPASSPWGGVDTWLLPLSGDRVPVPLISTPFYEGHAQVSPDGKWIAFASLESGDMQVYVRPFTSADPVWQVSTTGGVTPRWRQDGKELFYVTSYDNGKLMAVSVGVDGGTFVPGTPRELFDVGIITPPHSTTINVYHWYAVAPDGQRVLIPRPVSALRGEGTAPITVVLHWEALLDAERTTR